MKKSTDWTELLREIDDPKNQVGVNTEAIINLLSKPEAKHFNLYLLKALSFTIGRFMENPNQTEKEQDYYRGCAAAYRHIMALRSILEKQVGEREKQITKAKSVGDAGY